MIKHTKEQLHEFIQQQADSGLSIKAFCLERKISSSHFYKLRKQLASSPIKPCPERSAFVQIPKPKPEPQQTGKLELHFHEVKLTFYDAISTDFLLQVVKGLAI